MPEVFSGHDKAFLAQPRIRASLCGLLAAVRGCAEKGVLRVLAWDGGTHGGALDEAGAGQVLSAPHRRRPPPPQAAGPRLASEPQSLSPPGHPPSSLLLSALSKDRRIKPVYPEGQPCPHFCENLSKAKRSWTAWGLSGLLDPPSDSAWAPLVLGQWARGWGFSGFLQVSPSCHTPIS